MGHGGSVKAEDTVQPHDSLPKACCLAPLSLRQLPCLRCQSHSGPFLKLQLSLPWLYQAAAFLAGLGCLAAQLNWVGTKAERKPLPAVPHRQCHHPPLSAAVAWARHLPAQKTSFRPFQTDV